MGWSNLYAGEIHLVDIGQHLGDLVAVLKDRTCRLCEVIERRVTTQYLSQRSHGIHLFTHTCTAFTCSHTPVLHSPVHTHLYCIHLFTHTCTAFTCSHTPVLHSSAHTHLYCIHLLTHTCTAFTCSHTPVLHSPAHTHLYCIHLLTHTCTAFTCSHTPVLHLPVHTHLYCIHLLTHVPTIGGGSNQKVGGPISPLTSLAIPPFPNSCLLYTSPSPRDRTRSRMPSSA